MSSIYYAQLDNDDVCTSVTEYAQTLDNPPSNYKVVDSFDDTLVGKKWNGSSWEVTIDSAEDIAESAKQWRNSELAMTDVFVLLPDHPNKSNLLTYRTALRDWPSTSDFPATKPVLGE
jgi:hypothetical protein